MVGAVAIRPNSHTNYKVTNMTVLEAVLLSQGYTHETENDDSHTLVIYVREDYEPALYLVVTNSDLGRKLSTCHHRYINVNDTDDMADTLLLLTQNTIALTLTEGMPVSLQSKVSKVVVTGWL